MQGFIHILKINSNYEIKSDIESLFKQYKSNSLFVHEKEQENIKSIYFTNEYVNYPYGETIATMFTPVGIFTQDIEEIKDSIINLNDNEKAKFINNLGGQFALGYSDFSKREINLFTHVGRIETLYSFVNKDIIIVGTDPLIISLIATDGSVEFDLTSMYSFILNGYYADDRTPFSNVYALPGNSHIKIDSNGINVNNLDDLYGNLLNVQYTKSDYDNLTDTFINAFNTQTRNRDFRMALTGGKDSRLIFAAMNTKNFNLSVFTNGFEDNPDVVIAKNIADMYNIEHKTTSPKISEENTISINIYKKIKRVMLATSGMVYGYENVGALGNFIGNKSFDGVGAELVKGGFANFINSDENSNKVKLVNTFNRNQEFLKEGKNNPFELFLDDFINSDHGLHKLQILYSLKYRTGRLTSAAKNAANYTRQSHSPFLDNKFLKDALRIQYEDNKNEEIHYQILKRIDKRLIDIPFAKDRWRVEKTKPLVANDYNNWLARQPYYPSTVLGNYNWRQIQNNDKVIVSQFKDILLFNPNHLIYQIIDYNAVKNMFTQVLKPKHMRLIWSLASLIIFVNELNQTSNKSFDNNINLTLPSTSINNYKNKKQIFDLSNEFVSLNKSLELKNKDIKIINFNKHRKLKSFSGKYNEPPSEVHFENIKKLTYRSHITHSNANEKISGQILFFKNGERIKTFPLEIKSFNNSTEVSFETDKLSDYDSFRILINFNKLDLNETLKFNYAFYEVTY